MAGGEGSTERLQPRAVFRNCGVRSSSCLQPLGGRGPHRPGLSSRRKQVPGPQGATREGRMRQL